MSLVLRFGGDILLLLLAWRWTRRIRPARRRRRIQARAVTYGMIAIAVIYVIPVLLGPAVPPARHLGELLEAQKLRLYYAPLALLPGATASRAAIDREVGRAARRHDLDPALLRAVITQESGYRQFVVSRAGACGLMQLQPTTFFSLCAGNPFAYRSNIRAGAKYLAELERRFGGDTRRALAAYNCGPSAVARGRVPAASWTYADRVLAAAERGGAAFSGME